ncbi:sensor histidine kinase [Marinomonas mediterranea]|uniref:sensor histidine kinase n=1 Tax=Marinomonas mediterranea TaxID=119864 RepID=UPI002349A829|nr:HAMP domain-containing sensor histidine kinase [Marinomonas mediterranea]WCN08836.1 sensor histidine kinase [Marinomonas mediterranea]
MNAPIRTSRQLTFIYFAIVAFAIITFHFAMIDTMIETMERVYAKERISKDVEEAKIYFHHHGEKKVVLSKMSRAYLGDESLPSYVLFPESVKSGEVVELIQGYKPNLEMFGVKEQYIDEKGIERNLYLVHYDEVYEASEGKVFKNQFIQLSISILLLFVSLIVVLLIARRLTQPLSNLTRYLENRATDDQSAIPVPDGIVTREIVLLVNQLNLLQEKNARLIERERAFNRRASHELRTPLMVIRGAANLLKRKVTSEFEQRQVHRLEQATHEMTDYIETLLMLSQIDREMDELVEINVSRKEVQEWITHFDDLHVTSKTSQVSFELTMPDDVLFAMPLPAFKIVVVNLLKNAFEAVIHGVESLDEEQVISLDVSNHKFGLMDSGEGLSGTHNPDGHGLGLVIVKDICNQYGYQFELSERVGSYGCVAIVEKPSEQGTNVH